MKAFTAFVGVAAGRYDGRLSRHGQQQHHGSSPTSMLYAESDSNNISRRSFGIMVAGIFSAGPFATMLPKRANAMGLVQFPCPKGELANTYHILRAGQSLMEAQDILCTNALFLTNHEDALSELGVVQVEQACEEMRLRGINPSVVKYSLASKCIDSANIVATNLLVGRNRIVPEFTFMDQRGVGLWDGKPLESTEAAIWAMDAAEAGEEGRGGKPPQNDDGTANETLFEQVTRLRQLMSVLETQYSGDDILLIFPDGTSPALLSCLIAGIPLKDVHALNFVPGELREGVNMDNTRQLLAERITSPQYLNILAKGQDELRALRKETEEYLVAETGSKKLLMPKPKKSDSLITAEVAAEEVRRRMEERRANYSPDIFSAGALCAMGGLALLRFDVNDEKSMSGVTEPEGVLAFSSSSGSSRSNMFDTVPLATSTVLTAVINDDDLSADLNVFQDVPVMSKEDRIKAAERAMEDYLSIDDDALYLASLQEIMKES